MRPEDLRDFNRRQTFTPYRIHITGGQAYDIRYPDQALVLRSLVIIGIDSKNGIADRVEYISLLHIMRIEELQLESVA